MIAKAKHGSALGQREIRTTVSVPLTQIHVLQPTSLIRDWVATLESEKTVPFILSLPLKNSRYNFLLVYYK